MISDIGNSSNVSKITPQLTQIHFHPITSEHWIRMLLFMLFLLGIDSAFSFLEAIVAVLEDTRVFKNVDSKILCLGLTVRKLYCIKIVLLDLFFYPVTYTHHSLVGIRMDAQFPLRNRR